MRPGLAFFDILTQNRRKSQEYQAEQKSKAIVWMFAENFVSLRAELNIVRLWKQNQQPRLRKEGSPERRGFL